MSAVFMILGLLLATPIVKLMGAEPDVIPISASYFKINVWGLPFMIITMIMNGVLRGGGDTKTPMYINGISNIVNIVGNFFLIYESRTVNINIPFIDKSISFCTRSRMGSRRCWYSYYIFKICRLCYNSSDSNKRK